MRLTTRHWRDWDGPCLDARAKSAWYRAKMAAVIMAWTNVIYAVYDTTYHPIYFYYIIRNRVWDRIIRTSFMPPRFPPEPRQAPMTRSKGKLPARSGKNHKAT